MKNRLRYLTISLVLLLLLLPFVERGTAGPILYNVLLSVVLAAGIYALSRNRRDVAVGLAFGLPWFVLSWVATFTKTPSPTLLYLLGVFWILFLGFTALVLLLFVLESERVSEDVLFGAASVYLLIGGTWAGIYSLLEAVTPGSFAFDRALNPDGVIGTFDFIYLSFTSLTTMGYGDLVPTTSYARSFAVLEAIVGVMFLAIIISRLVGMYIAQASRYDSELSR